MPGSHPTIPGLVLRGDLPPGHEKVLTPTALALVADLCRRFGPRVAARLDRRRDRQRRFDAGERPHVLSETEEVRGAAWTVAPIPADLLPDGRSSPPGRHPATPAG